MTMDDERSAFLFWREHFLAINQGKHLTQRLTTLLTLFYCTMLLYTRRRRHNQCYGKREVSGSKEQHSIDRQ
jgi:hypothetical protein